MFRQFFRKKSLPAFKRTIGNRIQPSPQLLWTHELFISLRPHPTANPSGRINTLGSLGTIFPNLLAIGGNNRLAKQLPFLPQSLLRLILLLSFPSVLSL